MPAAAVIPARQILADVVAVKTFVVTTVENYLNLISLRHLFLRDKIRTIKLYLCIYKRGKSEDTLLQNF